MKSVELHPVMHVDQHVRGRKIVAASMGPGLDVWLSAQDATSTLVLRYPGGNPLSLLLPGLVRPFGFVQPLPREETLLWDTTPGASNPTYDGKGRFVRELPPIDGVLDVQATPAGRVIVASRGLQVLDLDGRVDSVHVDQPIEAINLDALGSLHIASPGQLTTILPDMKRLTWKLDVAGVSALAVDGGRALLLHGDGLTLVGLGRTKAQVIAQFRHALTPAFRQGRGKTLFLLQGTQCFKVTVDDVGEL